MTFKDSSNTGSSLSGETLIIIQPVDVGFVLTRLIFVLLEVVFSYQVLQPLKNYLV